MEKMYYIGLDVHKKEIRLLREGRERPDSRRGRNSSDPAGPGSLDANPVSTMDRGDGSDHLHTPAYPHDSLPLHSIPIGLDVRYRGCRSGSSSEGLRKST